ncbi:MAG: biopolymer transporter ExbD [Bacteroidetes bacterium]|nr:biopolymer transporter ExbD [Bacteroidota bacterium]
MPKVKIARKSIHIDMTAMTDVAFLLLTFFMLTTKFKPDEPFIVDMPSSISEIMLPDADIMQIAVEKEGEIFFTMDGQEVRANLLRKMGEQYQIKFTEKQITQFALLESFGLPIAQLPQFLDFKAEQRVSVKQTGIPCDTVKNELRDWIWFGRLSNPKVRIAIKGDRETHYPVVKRIMDTLQERKVNRFNFITNLESGSN